MDWTISFSTYVRIYIDIFSKFIKCQKVNLVFVTFSISNHISIIFIHINLNENWHHEWWIPKPKIERVHQGSSINWLYPEFINSITILLVHEFVLKNKIVMGNEEIKIIQKFFLQDILWKYCMSGTYDCMKIVSFRKLEHKSRCENWII